MTSRQTRSTSLLSKSRFISGWQCHLKLWYDTHKRELAAQPDSSLQAIYDVGHQVGELAQKRWPGGVLVEGPHWQVDSAIAQTRELLAKRSVPAIYEAAITYKGTLTRVDILARAPRGTWNLIEVKSSTRVKEPFDTDLAVQYWILRKAGLRIRQAGILVLNRDYIYRGGELDLEHLFRFEDLTEHCKSSMDDIGEQVLALQKVMRRRTPPKIDIGPHCSKPYDCLYWDHCARDIELPDYPLDILPHLRGQRRQDLEAAGIVSVLDIPPDFTLTEAQARVREATVSGKPWVSPQLKAELERVEWPLYFLDFEAANPAIPQYRGTRPYDALPFQFSCHVQKRRNGKLIHHEYLHTDSSDPRKPLAEALLQALGDKGSIIVYSSYEATTIEQLAKWLPKLAPQLRALLPRLYDLRLVVLKHYYHPDFMGKSSIKMVLPVLVNGMSYEGMEIADGGAASASWIQMINSRDEMERAKIARDLRDYCGQDSLAMAELRAALLFVSAD